MCGVAEVERRIDPSIHLGPAPGLVERGHQRVAVCIWLANNRRPAIRPIGLGERRRIQRRGKPPSRWGWRRSSLPRPVQAVKFHPAGKEILRLGDGRFRRVRERNVLFIRLLCATDSERQERDDYEQNEELAEAQVQVISWTHEMYSHVPLEYGNQGPPD